MRLLRFAADTRLFSGVGARAFIVFPDFNRLDDPGGGGTDAVEVGEDLFGGRIFPTRGNPGRKQHVTIDVLRKPSARSLG